MNRFHFIVAVVAAVVIGSTSIASSFERDTHYYTTYALALTTCFDWEEAHLIASADVMIDGSRGTVAELNPTHRHNKAAWHAFGHTVERYYELWERVLLEQREELRLIAFGQFLHFLQDWEAHAGYPVHLGHAKATILGHDPDSMARSEARTRHSIQATLDHMALLCREMDRLPDGVEGSDQALEMFLDQVMGERLIRDLIDASDPGWRNTLKGKLTDRGVHVMAENVHRIERYLEQQVAPLPDKNVPADFEPGSDPRGIPEPIELDFDSDGTLLSDLDLHLEGLGRHPEDDHLDAADHYVRVVRAKPTRKGWKVQVEVTNIGDKPMPAGELVAIAIDAVQEAHLGEASVQIAEMQPDETRSFKLMVPATRPAETALIGVSFVSPHDRDPYNSDVWHVTAEDLDELEAHVAAYGHLHGVSRIPDDATLEIVAAPRLWLTRNGRLCAATLARGTSADPTIHVEEPGYTLTAVDGAAIGLNGVVPTVWTITPSNPGEVPAVKSYACFDLEDQLCGNIENQGGGARLEVSVGLGGIRRNSGVELGADLGEAISRTCRSRAGE